MTNQANQELISKKPEKTLDIDSLLRHEFPVTQNLIYLNHAAVAPWPRRTAEAIAAFAEENLQYGARNYPEWVCTETRLRKQLSSLINAPSHNDIALLKNTSEALSVVAHGMAWQPGDNVVISDEEFPSNRIVWESLADMGVLVRQAALQGRQNPEQALLEAADSRTRLISISSVQYVSGLRLDLALLGRLCRDEGIPLCVDAIQGLGVFPHDVQAMHIDFLMADGHKWLLGPEGLAVFYCRPEWRERLLLHQYGWHMVEDHMDFDRKDWQPAASARRFECGSPNMLGIHALSASLSLIQEIGVNEIEPLILARAEFLFDVLADQGHLELITDPHPGRYAGIVTFRHKDRPPEAIARTLLEHNVICAQRGGGIRFSPHCYTSMRELERVTELIKISVDN